MDIFLHIRQPNALICSLEGWHRLALRLIQRVHRYCPVSQFNLLMRLLLPCERVLHPFLVVAVWEILTGMRAA